MRALEALRAIHDELWDDDAALVRVPPGAATDVDVAALGLHSVRETALGVLVDLEAGQIDRVERALNAVLDQQYAATDAVWAGTFKVTAEQHDPPDDAVEWLHYDPNWRQFLGCILACTVERYGSALRGVTVERIEAAIGRAVHGEPVSRIADWYTNPALMQAWLCAWFGRRTHDRALFHSGHDRLARLMARLDRHADVDEYNSPTYDGVDLFAAALWCAEPPSEVFAEAGERLVRTVGSRLSTLYHPALGAICGPYIRAYGIQLDRYVSLAGEWLALAGADDTRVLPPELTPATDHVHDLYFLPLFRDLAGHVLPHLRIHGVGEPRHHHQAFGGVLAQSRLTASAAIGCETGRVHNFARQQYVPFTAHFFSPAPSAVAFRPAAGTAVVAADLSEADSVAVRADGGDAVAFVVDASEPLTVESATCTLGAFSVEFDREPDEISGNRFVWHRADVGFVGRVRA